MVFPVAFIKMEGNDEEEGIWEPIPYKLLKELKQACHDYGSTSPYTLTLLDALAGRWMTPYDWRAVARACLPGGEYLLWLAEYYKLARLQSAENKTSSDAKLRAMGSATLRGDEEYESNIAQARLSKAALNQIMSTGVLAWKSLAPSNGKLSTLSNIKQGPDEKYEDFVARLKTAVKRTIKSTEPAEIVLKRLAYENAKSIQTCQEVGTSFMQGVDFTASLRGETAVQVIQGMRKNVNRNRNDFTNKRCFSCGQMGHFCLQCPAKQGQQAVPIQTNTNPPKALCPQCQKGYHWAKDCRSEFHKDGTTLTPQVQKSNFSQFQGNGQQGQPQPQTTIGAVVLNPFSPFVPSQNSSEQPQVLRTGPQFHHRNNINPRHTGYSKSNRNGWCPA